MKKTNKIDINKENPFKNCKLKREPIADNLTKIIEGIDGSFVMGIDSPWGTGKTTFIKMWVKKLEIEYNSSGKKEDKVFPIYFNAWENDFHGDPLSAIVGELEKHISTIENANREDIKTTFGLLGNNIVKLVTRGVVDLKEIKDTLDKRKDRELFINYKEYEDLKNNILKNLKDIKVELGVKKVIFFIDELDRCRPDYAVQTLEKIKHFFDVEDYVFVLALDKKQLSHSVATIYGEGMDSEGYLRRFIDLDYSLPEANKEDYLNYLMEQHGLKIYSNKFIEVIKRFSKEDTVSLRDLEKLFYIIKLVIPLSDLVEEIKRGEEPLIRNIKGVIYAYFICLSLKYKDLYLEFTDGKVDFMKVYQSTISNEFQSVIDDQIPVNVQNFNKSLKWLDVWEESHHRTSIFRNVKNVLNEISSKCNGKIETTTIEFTDGNSHVSRIKNFDMNLLFKNQKFIIKEQLDFISEFKIREQGE